MDDNDDIIGNSTITVANDDIFKVKNGNGEIIMTTMNTPANANELEQEENIESKDLQK